MGDTECTLMIVTVSRDEMYVMDATHDESYALSKKNVTKSRGMRAGNAVDVYLSKISY